MRTKTLLIAAAALAAAITTSQAQTVYSQNVVGYVNTPLTGGSSFTMICNPVNGTTNGAEELMPGLQGGETLYIWNGGGYFLYTFEGVGAGASFGAQNSVPAYQSDWIDGSAGPDSAFAGFGPPQQTGEQTDTADDWYWTKEPQLTPGQGVFVQNPNTTETNTFTGTVITTNSQTITGGSSFSLVASAIPVGGDVETNQVINLTGNFQGGETVYVWNGGGYFLYTYEGAGAGASFGAQNSVPAYQSDWIDGSAGPDSAFAGFGPPQQTGEQTDTADDWYWVKPVQVTVGQGFFVLNPNGSEAWNQTITNIP